MKIHFFAMEAFEFFSSHTLVNNDFQILFGLLENRDREVTGRVAAVLPTGIREEIARFAAGRCSEEERAQMKKLLREQPDLLDVLAAETQALRPSDK
jgi:hypothetical protein